MLIVVYVLNFLSRQLPGILAKPIQDSLHLSDGQLGRIGGLYFALFYCCISIPVGWLADKTSRSKVLAVACAIWSAATMCCGGAANFLQFAIAYMTVGFGEAGGVPPSYSIISDYFPPGRRGQSAGPLQHRTADWFGAGNCVRRFHRCCFQLALCICHRSAPLVFSR